MRALSSFAVSALFLSLAGQESEPRNRDEAVLNAVLEHVLDDESEEVPWVQSAPQRVFLHWRNPETTGLLDQTLNLARNKNGHSEAIADVLARNSRADYHSAYISYAPFTFDPRVTLGEAGMLYPNDPSHPGLTVPNRHEIEKYRIALTVYAPGFSKDGQTAVVVAFRIKSPMEHPVGAVYYLKLKNSLWEVQWRKFIFYV
jgi:hypothetical protein